MPTLSDAATLSSASTIASTLPLPNLQTMQPGEVCRFTSLTGMHIVADLASEQAINTIALLAHNGSSDAKWRIRGADTEAELTSDPGYDSGSISMWPSTGKPSGYDDVPLPSIKFLTSAQTYRWWRIDITDADNADGYFQAGRLYIAAAWQPTVNIALGWSLGFIDDSGRDVAIGGQLWPHERPRRRLLRFELDFQTEDAMYDNAYEIDRLRGMANDVLVIRDPAATTHLHRQTVHGLLTELQPIVNEVHALYRKPYTVEEMVP